MQRMLASMASCGLFCLGCLVSFNAEARDPQLAGFYAGANIGEATLQLEDSESRADFDGDATAYKLYAGYRIIDWVAVEASYAQYGEPRDGVLGVPMEGEFDAYSLSALGLLPLNTVDLFARLGVARWEGELRDLRFGGSASEDNFDPLLGIGAQASLGRVALRAEIETLLLSFDDDEDDESDGDDWITTLAVGLLVKF